jgi:hypothetical protein
VRRGAGGGAVPAPIAAGFGVDAGERFVFGDRDGLGDVVVFPFEWDRPARVGAVSLVSPRSL